MIRREELKRYGYTSPVMIGINGKTARKIWDKITIYKLYPDNTEAELDGIDEIELDGTYGVEKEGGWAVLEQAGCKPYLFGYSNKKRYKPAKDDFIDLGYTYFETKSRIVLEKSNVENWSTRKISFNKDTAEIEYDEIGERGVRYGWSIDNATARAVSKLLKEWERC